MSQVRNRFYQSDIVNSASIVGNKIVRSKLMNSTPNAFMLL
jgi:hypothetical protein